MNISHPQPLKILVNNSKSPPILLNHYPRSDLATSSTIVYMLTCQDQAGTKPNQTKPIRFPQHNGSLYNISFPSLSLSPSLKNSQKLHALHFLFLSLTLKKTHFHSFCLPFKFQIPNLFVFLWKTNSPATA